MQVDARVPDVSRPSPHDFLVRDRVVRGADVRNCHRAAKTSAGG
jgi:hypothetical protein